VCAFDTSRLWCSTKTSMHTWNGDHASWYGSLQRLGRFYRCAAFDGRSGALFDRGKGRKAIHKKTNHVYFIRVGKSNRVKIGESVDPERRRDQLQTGNPDPLELEVAVTCSDPRLERELHALLSTRLLTGEFFRLSRGDVQFVVRQLLFYTRNGACDMQCEVVEPGYTRNTVETGNNGTRKRKLEQSPYFLK
jgi:hypothetical protein